MVNRHQPLVAPHLFAPGKRRQHGAALVKQAIFAAEPGQAGAIPGALLRRTITQNLMRDIFTEIFANQPLDPMESARRGARPQLRKRFYARAHIGEGRKRGRFCRAARRQAGHDAGKAAARGAGTGAGRSDHAEWNSQARCDRPGAHAADAAGQCGDRRRGGAAAAGRRGGGEISWLRSPVLSRRGTGRSRRAAGAVLGPGARPGRAMRSARALCWRRASCRWRSRARPSPPRREQFPTDPWRLTALSPRSPR